VVGWDSAPPDLRVPLPSLVHLCFDGMVAIGMLLVVLGAWQAWRWWFHRTLLRTRWFLVPAALAGLAAIAAMEMGWIVTEVGRQPWVVYGILRTSDAVTASSGVPVTLAVTVAIYLVLTGVTIGVPWLMSRRWRAENPEPIEDSGPPYGPTPDLHSTRPVG